MVVGWFNKTPLSIFNLIIKVNFGERKKKKKKKAKDGKKKKKKSHRISIPHFIF